MSKKKPKRRHSKLPDATVLAHLTDICDCIDNPSGFLTSDTSLLATQTSKILSLATNETSERKALIHKASNGIAILLKALKLFDDINVVTNIISILDVLANHKYISHLVRVGVVTAVMTSLSDLYRLERSFPDSAILSLLYKLSIKDKKFAVKARLCGMLPIAMGLLKKHHDDQERLLLILALLRPLASNGLNADSLGKIGCLSMLVKLLIKIGQKDTYILKYCINVLTPLLKQRSNVKRPAAQGCVKQLVVLHEHLHRTDFHSRHIPLRKNILNCLRFCISTDSNLQVFHKNNGLFILYTTAKQSSEGTNKSSLGIASLTCLVLRKCLPLVPLPLVTMENYTYFPLPDKQALQRIMALTRCSGSSSLKTTTTELSLLLRTSDIGELHQEEEEGRDDMTATLWGIQDGVPEKYRPVQSECPCPHESKSGDELVPILCGGEDGINAPAKDDGDGGGQEECGGDGVTQVLPPPPPPLLPAVVTQGNTIEKLIDLMRFKKFFPEIEEAQGHLISSQILPLARNSSLSDKMDKELQVRGVSASSLSERPIVVVPTAVCNDNSTEESLFKANSTFTMESTSEVTDSESKATSRDTTSHCTQFVEKPSPQVLGHLPPSDPEPLYNKTLSVDRKLYLSDIARIINQKQLINRVVFDLDSSLMSTSQVETSPQTSAESREPPEIPKLASPLRLEIQEIKEDVMSEVACCGGPLDDDEVELSDGSTDAQVHGSTTYGLPRLEFESRFESGNLKKAIQVCPYEYDLLLNADINTDHHHQWFYFKVSNTEACVPYRFNIINCEKSNSQFNFGMQPVMYSTTEFHQKQQGWVRAGSSISYYKNNYFSSSSDEPTSSRKKKTYYTLTFTLTFQHVNDTCYLAYHYPYTYSMLRCDLEKLEDSVKDRDLYYHRQTLCTTLCGNMCPLITVSSLSSMDTGSGSELKEKEDKKYIVLSARVHPGESNSSWIMKGVLQHLTSDHPTAQLLRDNFVFKIIPMLNPDGVIHGSHRCSLSGEDLNRQWQAPSPVLHPTIYATKSLLQWLVATNRKPEVYCDFHGHSRRKNIFMYGCRDTSGSNIEQVLPRHLDRIAPLFSYSTCSFVIEKSKEATARVVVWRELGVARSYTMESTYCGADQGQHKGRHIGTTDLESMGEMFCEGLQLLEEQSEYAGSDSDIVKEKREVSPLCHSDSSYKSSSDASSASSSQCGNESS